MIRMSDLFFEFSYHLDDFLGLLGAAVGDGDLVLVEVARRLLGQRLLLRLAEGGTLDRNSEGGIKNMTSFP